MLKKPPLTCPRTLLPLGSVKESVEINAFIFWLGLVSPDTYPALPSGLPQCVIGGGGVEDRLVTLQQEGQDLRAQG